MKKPLTVYSLSPHTGNASFWYRIDTILLTARDLGLNVRAILDRNDATTFAEDRVRQFCESDVILLYQPMGEGPINNLRGVQSFVPSKRDGDWKHPPSVVIETDDNLFNVSPLNQAFKSLGIRDMRGETIPLGNHVGVMEKGEKKMLWYDVSQGNPLDDSGLSAEERQRFASAIPIDLVKNRQGLASYKTILEMADAVSCSTPEVANAVSREVAARRVEVFPNLVRMQDYPQVALAEEPGKVKILWQGGIAHYEDWYPLREALGRVTAKYPQVEWIIWGAQFPWVNELIPSHRFRYLPWCAYQEYKLRLAMVGHDISLAPLSDNVFNRCRSAIKWYESSVLRKPAATLAQATGAYKAEIEDEKTALLFNSPEEFEEKLGRLIEDVTLRQTLAANAKDWVSENRDAMKKVPKVVAFWESLREERLIEQPHVNEAHWAEIEAEDQAEQEAELAGTPA